jgi:glycosyltransferase involved in cell wall biosynthesis
MRPAAYSLKYVGMVRSWASWAKIARCRLTQLAASGWKVGIAEVSEDRFDPTFPLDRVVKKMINARVNANAILTFISPLEYPKLPTGVPRVGQLDYEGSRWPAEWVTHAQSFVDHIVVPSNFNRETLVSCGISPDKIDVVPYGFDPEVFTATNRFPAGANDFLRLLFVGTPARRKGLDILFAAIELAFSPRDKVNLRVHVVDYPDQHTRPYLDQDWRTRAGELKLKGYVVDITTTMMLDNEMANLYRSADLLCHTFRAESFCIPILEAMACGTPILATAWGGPLDFLNPSVGFPIEKYALVQGGDMLLCNTDNMALVAEPNVEEVAAKLRYAFEHRDCLQACGNAAAQWAKTWSWVALNGDLARVIEKTILDKTN